MTPTSLLACLMLVCAAGCSSKSRDKAPEPTATPPATPSPSPSQPGQAAQTPGDASAPPAGSREVVSLTGNAAGWALDTPEAQEWFELTGEVVQPSGKALSIAELASKLKTCTATVELPVYWQSADPKKKKRVLGKIPAGTPFGTISEPSAKQMEMPAPTGKRWVEPPSPPTCVPARP